MKGGRADMNIQFHRDKIEKLMSHFYMVTGHQIALFDEKGRKITQYPFRGNVFCEVIKSVPEGQARCDHCDKQGIKMARASGHLTIYNCHAGLIELCLPIKKSKYDDEVLGFMMIGHLLRDHTDIHYEWKDVCRKCEGILPEVHLSKDIFQTIKLVSQEYINALGNMLEACVRYIIFEQLILQTQTGLWERLKTFIADHAKDSFSVDDIAAALSVSISSLRRCALENTGLTVGKLILQEKLKLACDYLQNTDIPISEVAAKSGISDYNYFFRIFKKRTGMSPRQFRKNAVSEDKY